MKYESILIQLGFNPNNSLKEDLKRVISSMPCFEKIEKHIINLNDKIRVYGGQIGLSSSSNYFKIKTKDKPEVIDIVENWAKKHKIQLIKATNNNYYIAGRD